jgi:hypothetical protein
MISIPGRSENRTLALPGGVYFAGDAAHLQSPMGGPASERALANVMHG